MYKAGATFRDKNRIRKLYLSDMPAHSISQLTRVTLPHVKAIIKQIEAGTLHVTRGEIRSSGGSYGEGGEGQDPVEAMPQVKAAPPAVKSKPTVES